MTGGTYWYSTLHGWVWKWHEWQDVIDWTLSAAGALSLVALNVIRCARCCVNIETLISRGNNLIPHGKVGLTCSHTIKPNNMSTNDNVFDFLQQSSSSASDYVKFNDGDKKSFRILSQASDRLCTICRWQADSASSPTTLKSCHRKRARRKA